MKLRPILTETQFDELNEAFTEIGKYLPKEFNRKPQDLKYLGHWKATVFRTFLLYAGAIILPGILPDDFVLHFNYLSCAIRILCHPTDYKDNNAYAQNLLRSFVKELKIYILLTLLFTMFIV